MRLIGAMLLEQNDEWAVSRARCMSLESSPSSAMIHRPRAAYLWPDGRPEPASCSGHDRRTFTISWDAIVRPTQASRPSPTLSPIWPNAASETPATASKGAGTFTATYDTATKMLTWKGEYKDLSGDAKAAHFHGPAPVGKAAAPVIPIDASKSPFQGSATLTDAQAADLGAGMWYVNIHTAANPGGEIRGQIVKGK